MSDRNFPWTSAPRAWSAIVVLGLAAVLGPTACSSGTGAAKEGVKGDTGYVVIKDVGSRVGDIMLVDDSVVAPPGYVKCDGKKIQAENYPDYFSALRLTGRSSRVPELEAPAGKAYIIKVQQ